MEKSLKIFTIQGAGLSFALSSLLYVLTGNLLAFTVILVGAAAGFGFGLYRQKNPVSPTRVKLEVHPIVSHDAPTSRFSLAKFLNHPNLIARSASLILTGVVVFGISWLVGYYLLPEGALHRGAQAQMARTGLNGESLSVTEEWLKIYGANLFAALILVGGSLLVRLNGIPFGYLALLYNLVLYGLYVGTNSFVIPYPERLAPSLAIFARSGPYEILALCLLAAASARWARFEVQRLFRTEPRQVIPVSRITANEILVLILGLILLGAANWVEAAMVFGQ